MPAPQNSFAMLIYQYREFPPNDACTLPHWDIMLGQVRAAHKACSDFVFIGWDVAFTPDGPKILEGNHNWSAATYQTLSGEPLGFTNFSAVLAAQLGLR
jgi:hypothetical protein